MCFAGWQVCSSGWSRTSLDGAGGLFRRGGPTSRMKSPEPNSLPTASKEIPTSSGTTLGTPAVRPRRSPQNPSKLGRAGRETVRDTTRHDTGGIVLSAMLLLSPPTCFWPRPPHWRHTLQEEGRRLNFEAPLLLGKAEQAHAQHTLPPLSRIHTGVAVPPLARSLRQPPSKRRPHMIPALPLDGLPSGEGVLARGSDQQCPHPALARRKWF